MNVLLDTHAFVWLDSQPANLSQQAASICKDPLNSLFLSTASIWEMQIKLSLGKLTLPRPLPDIVEWQRTNNHVQVLSINLPHIYALDGLPDHHRDPFDRMLIAQATFEGLTIMTRDGEFAGYGVPTIW